MSSGNQHMVVMTLRFSKLTHAIPTVKIPSTHLATISLDHWLLRFCIPIYVLVDRGIQVVGRFFSTICSFKELEELTTTAHFCKQTVRSGDITTHQSRDCAIMFNLFGKISNIRRIGTHTYSLSSMLVTRRRIVLRESLPSL